MQEPLKTCHNFTPILVSKNILLIDIKSVFIVFKEIFNQANFSKIFPDTFSHFHIQFLASSE